MIYFLTKSVLPFALLSCIIRHGEIVFENAGDVGGMVAQALSVYGKLAPKLLPTVKEENEDMNEVERQSFTSEVNINLD